MDRIITVSGFKVPLLALLILAAFSAFALYAVGYDQGQLLSIAFGDRAYLDNYLHELFHDTRHSLGLPCH